jgi:hypothetical protein
MRIFRKAKPDDPRNDLDRQFARIDTGTAKNGSMVTHRYNLLWYRVECTDRINEIGTKTRRSDKYDTRHRICLSALGADIP